MPAPNRPPLRTPAGDGPSSSHLTTVIATLTAGSPGGDCEEVPADIASAYDHAVIVIQAHVRAALAA